MLLIEKTDVYGWEAAIRGMRNPMNSWDKSDSGNCIDFKSCKDCPLWEACDDTTPDVTYIVGPNDHKLMMNLRNAGTDHRKFMRMIVVYVDITAPLYWWKEFDTYKVGTVANSCSTMHKIHAKEFTLEDFSCEKLLEIDGVTAAWDLDVFDDKLALELTIKMLNRYRDKFVFAKDKKYWDPMIQLLPSSYNQKRTVMLNYEVLANMYRARKNHKLDEWHTFCDWILGLPYSDIITVGVTH